MLDRKGKHMTRTSMPMKLRRTSVAEYRSIWNTWAKNTAMITALESNITLPAKTLFVIRSRYTRSDTST